MPPSPAQSAAVVASVLGEGDWREELLFGTGGGRFDTRVSRWSDGATSVVVKLGPTERMVRTELAAYRDPGLRRRLPSEFEMPQLLAAREDGANLGLVLADAGSFDPLAMSPRWMEQVAGALGGLSTVSPSAPWWTRNHLAAESLRMVGDHRLEGHGVEGGLGRSIERLDGRADELMHALGRMPVGFAHLDAFTRNMRPEPTTGRTVLFDWSEAGEAPVGSDLATFVAFGLGYLDLDVDLVSASVASWVDAFAERADLEPSAIESGVRAVAPLRFRAMMHSAVPLAQAGDPVVAGLVGAPIDDALVSWERSAELMVEFADSALTRRDR